MRNVQRACAGNRRTANQTAERKGSVTGKRRLGVIVMLALYACSRSRYAAASKAR